MHLGQAHLAPESLSKIIGEIKLLLGVNVNDSQAVVDRSAVKINVFEILRRSRNKQRRNSEVWTLRSMCFILAYAENI